jgi:hypothetical protein
MTIRFPSAEENLAGEVILKRGAAGRFFFVADWHKLMQTYPHHVPIERSEAVLLQAIDIQSHRMDELRRENEQLRSEWDRLQRNPQPDRKPAA